MKTIWSTLKKRLSRSNAIGIVLLLKRSEAPHSVLLDHKGQIDDEVVDALLAQSFASLREGSIDQAFFWTELAREASLIGGSAKSLGECADWKATLLLKGFDDEGNAEGKALVDENKEILQSALKSATQALEIFLDAQIPERVPICQGRISTIYHRMNCLVPAIRFRLQSITSFLGRSNPEEAIPRAFDHLISLYWSVEKNSEIIEAAHIFVEYSEVLVGKVLRELNTEQQGKLFDLLGNVHQHLHRPDEAFRAGEIAVSYFEQAAERRAAYHTLARMQDYAFDLEDLEKLIFYGERCTSSAPLEVDPYGLAGRYHLLAFSYEVSERKIDAIDCLNRAAELYCLDKNDNHAAAECLLHVAMLEEEEGLYEQALIDLQEARKHCRAALTVWKIEITLARLLWQKQGKLGEAIQYADSAAQTAISITNNLTLRAISLYISGKIYERMGDFEKAFSRFTILVKVLENQPTARTLHFDKLYETLELPPSMAEAVFSANQLALVLGRVSETQHYQAILDSLTLEDWKISPSNEHKESAEGISSMQPMLDAFRLFAQGETNIASNPKEAILFYQEAIPYFEKVGGIRGLAMAKRGIAIANVRLGSYEIARDYFTQALDLFKRGPGKADELDCRAFLGAIEARRGNFREAFEQFSVAVDLAESHRGTIKDIEQRPSFFQNQANLAPYKELIWMSIRIGNVRKALEVVEQVKSRAFADSILRPDKTPMDYEIIDQAQEIKTNQDKWILQYATKQLGDDLEQEIAMLDESINLQDRSDTLQRRSQLQLLQSDWQSAPLNFQDMRNLCHL